MSRLPPPTPEEYKGKTVPPPPPPPQQPLSTGSRSNSQARVPPPPPRSASERSLASQGRIASNSAIQRQAMEVVGVTTRPRPDSAVRAPPTPSMAEREDLKHASYVPRAPATGGAVDDLDAIGPDGKKLPFVKRKMGEYKKKIVECQKSRHAMERAIICAVAIGLLWLTSLGLCLSIVRAFIIPPRVDDVVARAEQSMNTISEGKYRYENCAQRISTDCESQILGNIAAEKLRVKTLQTTNVNLINSYYQLRDACNRELNAGINTLTHIQVADGIADPQAAFSTNFSLVDPRCGLVDEMLQGGQGGIQALGTTERYNAAADVQVQSTMNALDSRILYDQQYTANKTAAYADIFNSTLSRFGFNATDYFGNITASYAVLLACSTKDGVYNGTVCPTETVLGQLQKIQDRANARYAQITASYDQYNQRATGIINQIKSFYDSVNQNAALRAAIDVGLALFGLPNLSGMGFDAIGSVPLNGFLLGSLPTPNYAAYEAQLRAQSQQYADSIAAQQELARQQAAALLAAQMNYAPNNPLPPYNPPPVNTTAIRSDWGNTSSQASAAMSTTLQGALAKGDAQTSTAQQDLNSTNPRNFSSTLVDNLVPTSWGSFFVYGGLDVGAIMRGLENALNTLVSLDYVWRAFRTLQIIKKYWRVSAIGLPPADVRTDHMQHKGLSYANQNIVQKMAMCLAHPATACIIIGSLAIAIFVLLNALYWPIYNDFVVGCIKTPISCTPGTTQGSLFNVSIATPSTISRNVYSISYSYAASDGDKELTEAINKIQSRTEITVNSELDTSQQIQNNNDRERNFIFGSHRDLKYQATALRDCLDIPAIDANSTTTGAANIATGGNFSTLGSAIIGPACGATIPDLPRALFNRAVVNCSTNFQCERVDPGSLLRDTWTASCTAEWYVHSTFLTYIMLVIVFSLLNCSRILTMRGLVRVFWRYLTDGRFSYLGTCERAGELRYPTIITDEGYSMKRAVRESLALRLKWWESKSFGILMLGLLLNVPWLYILVYVYDTMTRQTADPAARMAASC